MMTAPSIGPLCGRPGCDCVTTPDCPGYQGRTYTTPAEPTANQAAPPTDSLPPDPPAPSWFTIVDLAKDKARYAGGLPALSTGYAALDKPLRGGFRPECVYILAGRTGAAKSTLALNIARKTALDGGAVLLFKLEESPIEAVWRIHAAAAQVHLNRLLDGAKGADPVERARLLDGWTLIRDLPIRLSDARDLANIERIAKAHAEDGKLIVLDQLSMVLAPGHDQFERMTQASNRLRLLARDLRIPVLIVCQVNRPAATKKDHLSCHDLRDSGAIENDAAAVLLIDVVRKPEGPDWGEPIRYLQILIGKNRYGPTSDPTMPLELLWWPATARIEDATTSEPGGAE